MAAVLLLPFAEALEGATEDVLVLTEVTKTVETGCPLLELQARDQQRSRHKRQDYAQYGGLSEGTRGNKTAYSGGCSTAAHRCGA